MHRYREFGLVSERDETLRRAFRDGFRRAGLSFPQLLEALAWYRDHAKPGTDETRLVEAFGEFAAQKGWTPEHRDGAVGIYQSIRDGGPESVMAEAALPHQDRAVVGRAEDLLRRDPAQYWRDAELQEAAFEARQRLAGIAEGDGPAPPARGSPADRQRISDVEALLRDSSGAGQRRYWNDSAMRTDYALALSRLHGEITSAADGTQAPSAAAAAGDDAGLPRSAPEPSP